jgi:predicted nucleotide-binding protein (sugar kinase/HSP70/actin superfamily)
LKIGIPRALLYYWYGSIWEKFWQDSGFTVVTSPPTNRQIMLAGVETALDELCLPVKIFLGHVRALIPFTDRIMIPHLIKVEPDAFICPKFMGLPDIVCHAIPAVKDQLLLVQVGPRRVDMINSLQNACRHLERPPSSSPIFISRSIQKQIKKANKSSVPESPAETIIQALQNEPGAKSKLTIGLLGHPYCLYDDCFNLNLLQILSDYQVYFLTPEMMPHQYLGQGSGKLAKKMFWTTGRVQFDALEWMLHCKETPVDGFIQIAPFACGPEALVSDMLERRIKEAKKPCLKIYYEEHSGEAGVITRLEAFLDLMKYQNPAC